MSSKPGCLRPALFGCLGVLAVIAVILLVVAIMAWQGVQNSEVVEQTADTQQAAAAPAITAQAAGRVVLELAQGEFLINPAQPGEGVSVKARFDQTQYALQDTLLVQPDGTWEYRVKYGRTIPALQQM